MRPKTKIGVAWGWMALLILAATAFARPEPAATAPAAVSSGWPAACAAYVRIVGYCADRLGPSHPDRARRLQSSVEKLSVQWMDDVAQHIEPTVNGMDCTTALTLFTRVEAPVRGCGGDDLPVSPPAPAPAQPVRPRAAVAPSAAPNPPAIPSVSGAQTPVVTGDWDVHCCNGSSRFTLRITQQGAEGGFRGVTIDSPTHQDGVDGHVAGDVINFLKWGNWGEQMWVGRLVNTGGQLSIADGQWKGSGAAQFPNREFTAVQLTSTSAPGAPAPAAAAQVPPPADFAGQWTSNWGGMTLWQSRYGGTYEQVSGTFGNNNGRIVDGQARGGTATGIWTQNTSSQLCNTEQGGAKYWGGFRWTLSADGRSFEGSWGYCDGPLNSGAWNGARVGDSK